MMDIKRCGVWTKSNCSKTSWKRSCKRRIMDMGITKGVEIFVRKLAPLGDPIEVNIRNYELTLRKADAEMIEVK